MSKKSKPSAPLVAGTSKSSLLRAKEKKEKGRQCKGAKGVKFGGKEDRCCLHQRNQWRDFCLGLARYDPR